MKRRKLLGSAFALSCLPLPGLAQRAEVPAARIGWLTAQREAAITPYLGALRAGLAEAGYVEGRNLRIEFRFANDELARVPDMARELMSLPVSLLLTNGSAAAVVARLQLPVPVVFAISGDPVVAGVTDSLARPSRNMTGLTFMSVEANGKRIEILRDIVPALRRVAVIENPEHPGEEQERNYAVGVGRQLGIEVAIHPTRRQAELDAALVALSAEVPQAICIFPDGFTLQNRERIADFALQQKLPLIAGWSVFTQAGALCSYGPRLEASYRRLAHYVDRILKGAKPADLPIERSSVLELVLNQRTARTIGVSFPPGLVALADEVIE